MRRGRPNKFRGSEVTKMKEVVAVHGIVRGRRVLADIGISICLTTLSKYVRSRRGGPAVKLPRRRAS